MTRLSSRKTLNTLFILAAAMLIACAPEPTTPSEDSLAGVWTANAHLYTLSSFRMEIVQEPRGIVSGRWSAKGDGGGGGCPIATPCNAAGELIGRNTISQVEIELLGAGKFEGALLANNRMRGMFAVGESYDTITFVRNSALLAARGVEK